MADKARLTWTPVDNARKFFAEHAAEFRKDAEDAHAKAAAIGDSGDEIEIDTEDLDEDDDEIFGCVEADEDSE